MPLSRVQVSAALALVCVGACGGGPRALDGPLGGGPSGSQILDVVGFQERGSWPSAVLHLDGEEIEQRFNLPDLLERSHRVEIRRPEGTEWGIYLTDARGEDPCPVAVYLNGSRYGRVDRGSNPMGLSRLIGTESIAGMELHEGPDGPVIPGLDCAALLIWSPEADPVYGFLGDVTAVVAGGATELVTSVVLQPGSIEGRREGRYTFFSVLPGEYEVHFVGEDRTLDVRVVRAFAFAETEVSLEVN